MPLSDRKTMHRLPYLSNASTKHGHSPSPSLSLSFVADGSASLPLDHLFGTFRETLGETKLYKGAAGVDKTEKGKPETEAGGESSGRLATKSTRKAATAATAVTATAAGTPDTQETQALNRENGKNGKDAHNGAEGRANLEALWGGSEATQTKVKTTSPAGFNTYLILSSLLLLLPTPAALLGCGKWGQFPRGVAALVAFGPVLLSFVLPPLIGISSSRSLRWPFHKEPVFGKFGLHALVGFAIGVVPVYHLLEALLAPVGEGVFYQLWRPWMVAR